ncbi:MAG: hypothetical protein PUJ80_09775 [Verrucomicrobiota bacterium]|nr:hypothetical protein [Verrucomicrobiota bacterium]
MRVHPLVRVDRAALRIRPGVARIADVPSAERRSGTSPTSISFSSSKCSSTIAVCSVAQ